MKKKLQFEDALLALIATAIMLFGLCVFELIIITTLLIK